MTKIAVEIHKKDNKLYFKGSFPDLCVCCGQPKNVDKTYKADRVKKSHENSLIVPETLTLKLPYCTKHGEAFVFAKNAIAITVGFFVILAAFPAYWFFEWLFFLGPGPAIIITCSVFAFLVLFPSYLLGQHIASLFMTRRYGIQPSISEAFPPGAIISIPEFDKAYFMFRNNAFTQAFSELNRQYIRHY